MKLNPIWTEVSLTEFITFALWFKIFMKKGKISRKVSQKVIFSFITGFNELDYSVPWCSFSSRFLALEVH